MALILSSAPSHGADSGHDKSENSGHHFVPPKTEPLTRPTEVFSGTAPIDLKNGLCFNNGTFGARNPEIDKVAVSPTWAVSLSETGYPYASKDRFITTLDERLTFYEQALWNWSQVSNNTKPEVKAYAAQATLELKPRLEKARTAWSKAKSAGTADWETSSDEAKRTFLELQSYYYSLHKNVQ